VTPWWQGEGKEVQKEELSPVLPQVALFLRTLPSTELQWRPRCSRVSLAVFRLRPLPASDKPPRNFKLELEEDGKEKNETNQTYILYKSVHTH
jgi:hypothetical protein